MPRKWCTAAAQILDHHCRLVLLVTAFEVCDLVIALKVPDARGDLVNQIGRDTLPEMLALLARATVLLAPDSGPVHMATMVGTPVVGLYAATNPLRSGPYLSGRWCVDAYPQAARAFRGCEPDELPWNHKIEEAGVMDLIGVEQVAARLDELLVAQSRAP